MFEWSSEASKALGSSARRLALEFDDDAGASWDVGAWGWGLFAGDAAAERTQFKLVFLRELDGVADAFAEEVGDFNAALFDVENDGAASGRLVAIQRNRRSGR